jgi:2-polyprenyl-3-methyl-5-hydroxy-6-metoxy-1,4-benzoquinol methylase
MSPFHNSEGTAWESKQFPELGLDENAYAQQHLGLYQELYRILADKPAAKVLDIGCATGITYKHLPHREQYSLHGLEYVPEFLSVLAERGIEGKYCDINTDSFPYEDELFDVVVCTGIIEHTFKPKHLLNESVRVLKPGGVLMLATPNALSAVKRWDYFRGRNQFWPLIDNLFTRTYLKRCSILYSEQELRKVLPETLRVQNVIFLNEDNPLWKPSFLRACTRFLPARFRDVVVVFAQKA